VVLRRPVTPNKRCLEIERGHSSPKDEDRDLQTKRYVLLAFGYAEEQIEAPKVGEMNNEAVNDAIRKSPGFSGAGASPRQQVIKESELAQYVAEGWVARLPVNGSKFIVERAE